MVAVSVFSIRRFESGLLKPIKLNPDSAAAKVFFKVSDIHDFVEQRAPENEIPL